MIGNALTVRLNNSYILYQIRSISMTCINTLSHKYSRDDPEVTVLIYTLEIKSLPAHKLNRHFLFDHHDRTAGVKGHQLNHFVSGRNSLSQICFVGTYISNGILPDSLDICFLYCGKEIVY